MKRLMTTIIALTLAIVMALMNPVKILASNTTEARYLSEIKVGMGKSSSEAANALDGYTIVTDDKGSKVNFIDNAGGGWGSKGEKVVYIGYKTTANRARAQYIHDALNKFTDDDCNGAGLGDLLLNETKYEMGDDAYNSLSGEEKKRKKEESQSS